MVENEHRPVAWGDRGDGTLASPVPPYRPAAYPIACGATRSGSSWTRTRFPAQRQGSRAHPGPRKWHAG